MLQKSEIVASTIELVAEVVVSEIEWIAESIGLKFNACDLTRPGQRPGEFLWSYPQCQVGLVNLEAGGRH